MILGKEARGESPCRPSPNPIPQPLRGPGNRGMRPHFPRSKFMVECRAGIARQVSILVAQATRLCQILLVRNTSSRVLCHS
jgi:hypothetical protein